ncbi:MAG: CBS and ACT domain-containing protein [Oceanidesulfovibrio sp.]
MLVRDWMTHDVITVTKDTPMPEASKIMKENKISQLPVVDNAGHLVGIVSDRDIKAASPSKATTLDVHELYYLISSIKIKDIMSSPAFSVSPTDTVESAAVFLLKKDIGSLPVIDDDEKVVGIISDSDIFKVLIAITGAKHGGVQMGFDLPTDQGSLRSVLDDLRSEGARVLSILTSMEKAEQGRREVYIRVQPMDRSEENAIIEKLKEKYNMVYWARERVHPLI